MVLKVDAASATAVVSEPGAVPACDVDFGAGSVVCHLTQGYSRSGALNKAMRFVGDVKTTGDKQDYSRNTFGFIQVAHQQELTIEYAGRMPDHGAIRLRPAGAIGFFLDAVAHTAPFTDEPNNRFVEWGGKVHCDSGDHPALRVPKFLLNDATGEKNWLLAIRYKATFYPILSHMPLDTRKPVALATGQFELVYAFDFTWVGDKAIESGAGRSRILVKPSSRGMAIPGAAQAIQKSPHGKPLYNDVLLEAIKNTSHGYATVRELAETWFPGTPDNFWRDPRL